MNAIRIKLLVFSSLLLCHQALCYGQSNNNPLQTESLFSEHSVQTPAVAALVKNITYPMNYSSGIPEIKIPLYEIHNGDITLPIYMSYHASGIKINQVSGWVGQGWSLTAEPMISRAIKGKEDVSFTCDFDKEAFFDYFYRYSVATGAREEQPDEFYYQLPNKKGMFMYVMEPKDASSKFMSLPYENIKIVKAGQSFHIIDDDGTTYKFNGGGELSGERLYRTGWRASSVVSSNLKDSLSFVYDTYNTYQVREHNDYIVVIDQFRDRYWDIVKNRLDHIIDSRGLSVFPPDEWMQAPIVYSTTNNQTKSYQLNDNKDLVSDFGDTFYSHSSPTVQTRSWPVREIKFSQGKVVFTQDSGKQRLKKITVYDLQGVIVKSIQFFYTAEVYDRYYLEKIEISDKTTTVQEKYQFNYYRTTELPGTGNKAIDYWGYFNGIYRYDTETLVPFQTIEGLKDVRVGTTYRDVPTEFNIGSSLSRESDEDKMACGTLSSITYPTGAIDEFIYEGNKYRESDGNLKTVGGLRVKQIKTTGNNGAKKIRTFKYGREEDGAGKILKPINFDDFTLDQVKYYGDPLSVVFQGGSSYLEPAWGTYIKARYRVFFSQPLYQTNYEGGSPVMYDSVTEYEGTPEENSGKTVYEYSLKDRPDDPASNTTMQINLHQDWQYGHLLNKTVYQNRNGQYLPIERLENAYSCMEKNLGTIFVGQAYIPYVVRPCVDGAMPAGYIASADYSRTTIDIKAKLLMFTTHITYSGNDIIRKYTNYEYSNPKNIFPTKITESTSGTDNYITTLMYPQDYGSTTPYSEMVNKNIVSPVVKKGYIRGNKQILIETPYSKPHNNIYAPSSLTMQYSTSDSPDSRISYIYDNWGKIQQKTKDQTESVVYLWGYNHQSIVARIDNATYAEVVARISSNESRINAIASSSTLDEYNLKALNDLRASLPQAQITTYTYQPLVGVATITDPAGLTTYFTYDDFGRLKATYVQGDSKKELVEMYDYHYTNQ